MAERAPPARPAADKSGDETWRGDPTEKTPGDCSSHFSIPFTSSVAGTNIFSLRRFLNFVEVSVGRIFKGSCGIVVSSITTSNTMIVD
jgi:hypothetical protein